MDGVAQIVRIESALSLTISAGSTLGTTSGEPCRLWIVVATYGGATQLGAVNCLDHGTFTIFPLRQTGIATVYAEGGAGGADTAGAIYATTSTGASFTILGYIEWPAGLVTAGTWNTAPSVVQLYDAQTALPGQYLGCLSSYNSVAATGSTIIPCDNTAPQSSEGDQYLTRAAWALSPANLIEVEVQAFFASSAAGSLTLALFQDTDMSAKAVSVSTAAVNAIYGARRLTYLARPNPAGVTSFYVRAGLSVAGTLTFNGVAGAGLYGGRLLSYIRLREIMA